MYRENKKMSAQMFSLEMQLSNLNAATDVATESSRQKQEMGPKAALKMPQEDSIKEAEDDGSDLNRDSVDACNLNAEGIPLEDLGANDFDGGDLGGNDDDNDSNKSRGKCMYVYIDRIMCIGNVDNHANNDFHSVLINTAILDAKLSRNFQKSLSFSAASRTTDDKENERHLINRMPKRACASSIVKLSHNGR
jgi:hypothetical protein